MIYDSVKTTRVTHSNSALHLNAASHTVALHEARIISLILRIKDFWNGCNLMERLKWMNHSSRRWSLWKCCPRNTEWTRYSCYCMDGPWNISKTSNNFPTATRIAWVVWSLIWTTFITRARSAQRCNVLESSKTDIKEGLRRKTSCWTHRMYHRGTWYPLPER